MNFEKENFKYMVTDQSTIEEAWSVIEENDHRSVIVVKGERVVGTLSDGDLRKAMLAKRLLSTPVSDVMNVNFIYLTPENEELESQLFAEKKYLFIIPVVDERMRLLNILTR